MTRRTPTPLAVSLGAPVGLARWIGHRLLHEGREALPPTIFFFVGFNFVVLTSNLLVAHYLIGLGNFMPSDPRERSWSARQC